jgi:hypothetical protein
VQFPDDRLEVCRCLAPQLWHALPRKAAWADLPLPAIGKRGNEARTPRGMAVSESGLPAAVPIPCPFANMTLARRGKRSPLSLSWLGSQALTPWSRMAQSHSPVRSEQFSCVIACLGLTSRAFLLASSSKSLARRGKRPPPDPAMSPTSPEGWPLGQ